MKKEIIKFVKRANMWCRTTWESGKQKLEWAIDNTWQKKPKK